MTAKYCDFQQAQLLILFQFSLMNKYCRIPWTSIYINKISISYTFECFCVLIRL